MCLVAALLANASARMKPGWLASKHLILMTCRKIAAVYLLSLLLSRISAAEQPSDQEFGRRLDKGVPTVLQHTATPSASIAIRGGIVLVKAYGNARLDPAVSATRARAIRLGP
jgi:hypothetical protein